MRKLIAALMQLAFCSIVHAAAGFHGTVTSKVTHQPLVGVTVEASGGCLIGLPACSSYQSTTTAADGSYDVGPIGAGQASLLVHYQPGEANYAPSQQTFQLNDGDSLLDDVQLDLGATIQGTVRRASDQMLLDVIPLTLLSGDLSYIVVSTATGADGTYRIEQLAAGNYGLRTDHALPFQDQFYAARKLTPPSQGTQIFDTIALTPGQTVTADFTLVTTGQIEGIITDRYTGLAIANAPNVEFEIYDANDASGNPWLYDFVPTDASGHFVLQGLPDAPIHLGVYSFSPYYAPTVVGCTDPCSDISTATSFTAMAGTTQTADFSMFPGSVITGTVKRRSDGQPMQGVTVSAYLNSFILGQLLFAHTTTDAAGHYVLTGGLPGQVYVSATNGVDANGAYIDQVYADHNCVQGNCNNVGDLVDSPTYEVASAIDFQLDSGATISGRVLASDTGASYQGIVYLYAADDSLSLQLLADANGNFTTSGLQPGSYYLTAASGSIDYECVTYPDVPCDGLAPGAGASPIVITGTNDVSGVTLTLHSEKVFANGFE